MILTKLKADVAKHPIKHPINDSAKRGHPHPSLSEKVKKLNLTPQEKADVVEYMKALTGPFPKVETGRLP